MIIELYNIAMAGTMAIAGFLLTRDYVHFLQSTHSVSAVVKSIQHVFSNTVVSSSNSGTKMGYYPVLEYTMKGGPIAFTCIDEGAANRFHIGDKIRLFVSKSRRKSSRDCRSFVLLQVMLSVLVVGLLLAAFIPSTGMGLLHIIESSFVVATCLVVIVRFKRAQDETVDMHTYDIDSGKASYWLREPTAFKHWCKKFENKRQATRVRLSQMFGACCFVVSGGLAFGAIANALG